VAAQWSTPPRKGPCFHHRARRSRNGRRPKNRRRRANCPGEQPRTFPLVASSSQAQKARGALMDLRRHLVGGCADVAGSALAAVGSAVDRVRENASNLSISRRDQPCGKLGRLC